MNNIIQLDNYDIINGIALTHMKIHKITHKPHHSDNYNGIITVWLVLGFIDEGNIKADNSGFVRASRYLDLNNDGITTYFIENNDYNDFIQVSTTKQDFRQSDVLNWLIDTGQIDGTII